MDSFTFDGVSSETFDAYLFENNTFGAPNRVYEEIEVPGKNGILYIDNKRYANQPHAYSLIIIDDFINNYNALRAFITSRIGYCRLEDSLHPDEFYKALYASDVVVEMNPRRNMGKLTLEFSRKPQRFLKSGETTITITESEYTITNPTLFASSPMIRIYGEGTVGIGDNAITVLSADEYTDIDCETMEAYKGTESMNERIQIQNIDFPVLHAGDVGITLGSGITQVDITPRWWSL